jgi:choline-sulfatase
MLRYVDSLVERLIDGLRAANLWNDTVLVVTGDHGEALFERGIFGHGQNYLFDEVLRVPLLVRTPDTDSNRVDRQFSLAWLHELLADRAGLSRFALPASGRSSHVTEGDERDIVISDSINKHGHTIAARDGTHKFLSHSPAPGHGWPPERAIGPLEGDVTYDLRADSGESNPLSPDEAPSLQEEARQRLTMPGELSTVAEEVPATVQQNLEDLGYVM